MDESDCRIQMRCGLHKLLRPLGGVLGVLGKLSDDM
jgi:hypothetical protein